MNLKTIVFLITLTIFGWLSAHAEYKSIIVNLNDGDETIVNIYYNLRATFSDTEMLFKSDAVDIAIPRADIKSFSFSEDSAVKNLSSDLHVSFSTEMISFTNLPSASRICIYSPAGTQLLSTSATGEYAIATEKLPKGINIVKVNNLTYKVNIK
jgi:hypothetical protein